MRLRTWITAAALIAICAGCATQMARRGHAPPAPTGPPPGELKLHELASRAIPGSAEPHLCATPDGAILASWIEPGVNARGRALKLAALTGAHWSAVLTIASGDSLTANWANFPAPAPFAEHGLAVAWPWKSGAGDEDTQLRVSVSEDGGAHWSRPAVLHDDREGAQHGFVSLVPQGNGVRAVWLDGHNLKGGVEEGMADMTLHSRFVSATGTLGREQEIDERVCDCCQTAMIGAGADVVVAYRDRSADEIRDIAVVRLDGGHWTSPVTPRADGFKITGCPVNGPALAARGQRVAVAWFTNAEDQPRVYVAFSSNGGREFGTPLRVDDGRPMGHAGVALAEDGSAVVTWVESQGDGASMQLRARALREGARSGPSLSVAKLASARGTLVPQVATGDGREFVVAWTEPGKLTHVRFATLTAK